MRAATQDIKARTKQVRVALGMTKAQIADELGIARSAWVQYEDPREKRCITLEVASKLKEAYGFSLDWLYFGERLHDMPASIVERLRKAG